MPTKERSGILTFYLGFKIVMELFMAFVYFGGHTLFESYSPFYLGNLPQNTLIFAGIISLTNVVLVNDLFKWKKWAFWGLLITFFTMLILTASVGGTTSGITIALLYGLLQTKKNGVKAWDNLERISSQWSQKKQEGNIKKEKDDNSNFKAQKQFPAEVNMKKNEIFTIHDKYIQLEKLGEIYKKKILTEEEFKEEKRKILARSTNLINENNSVTKYELLEILGNLLNGNILLNDEFIREKEILLNKTDNKTDKHLSSEEIGMDIPSDYSSLIDRIHEEIVKIKNDYWDRYNDDLYQILIKECTSKEKSMLILEDYQSKYKFNLIDEIKKNNSLFLRISKYLTPFIEQGIIEKEFPHNFLE